MSVKNRSLFLSILVALATLGQVGCDLYLPSLPYLIDELNGTDTLSQLSVALYIGGLTFAQLIYGPVSDAFGRRNPLLTGLLLFVLGSVICALSTNIYVFLAARLLQGLGGGAAITLSRSMLRDAFSKEQLAKYASFMAVFAVAMMASAPMFGGYIERFLGWRFAFYILLCFGFVLFYLVFFHINETNQHKHPDNLRLRVILSNIKYLFTSRVFWGGALIASLSYSGFLAWLTAGPFVVQDSLGYSPVAFGWMAFGVAVMFCFTSYLNGRLIGTYSFHMLVSVGLIAMFFAAAVMMLCYLLGFTNVYVIIVPMAVYSMSTAFTFANCFAVAFEPFAKIAGIATAVYSFIQIAGGFISSSVMSYLHDNNQFPLACWLLGGSLLCIIIKRVLLKQS